MLDKIKNLKVSYFNQLPESDKHHINIIKNRLAVANERMAQIGDLIDEVANVTWHNFSTYDAKNFIQSNYSSAASTIYSHFEKTYSLTLKKNTYNEGRRTDYTEFDTELILKDIFSQLNGLSFQEYSKRELIEKFRYLCINYYTNEPRAEVRGNSIYFECKLFGFSYSGYSISNENANRLKAISLLCPHTFECIYEQYKLNQWSWREDYEPFQMVEVTDSPIFAGFKSYKNGKFQLKFVSKEKLLEFLHFMNIKETN